MQANTLNERANTFPITYQNNAKYEKTQMHEVVDCGCSWMTMVGVYECEWVQWDTIECWGTERRQG